MLYGFGLDVPLENGQVVSANNKPDSCGSIAGLQQMLKDLGHYTGPVNGSVMPVAGVLSFTKSKGMIASKMSSTICQAIMDDWVAKNPAQAAAGAGLAQGINTGISTVTGGLTTGLPGAATTGATTGGAPPMTTSDPTASSAETTKEGLETWQMVAIGVGVVALGVGVYYATK